MQDGDQCLGWYKQCNLAFAVGNKPSDDIIDLYNTFVDIVKVTLNNADAFLLFCGHIEALDVKAGTATAAITGMGNYKGTLTRSFGITKAANSISKIAPVSAALKYSAFRKPYLKKYGVRVIVIISIIGKCRFGKECGYGRT